MWTRRHLHYALWLSVGEFINPPMPLRSSVERQKWKGIFVDAVIASRNSDHWLYRYNGGTKFIIQALLYGNDCFEGPGWDIYGDFHIHGKWRGNRVKMEKIYRLDGRSYLYTGSYQVGPARLMGHWVSMQDEKEGKFMIALSLVARKGVDYQLLEAPPSPTNHPNATHSMKTRSRTSATSVR